MTLHRGIPAIGLALLLAIGGRARAADLPDIVQPLKTGQKAPVDGAVVIGIEDYAFVPGVPHASRDAEAMYNFLVYTRGIPASRVRRMTRDADREQILAAVTEVGASVGAEGTVWVYFAGHGAADPATSERLLLGNDVKPNAPSLSARGVPVAEVERLAAAGGGRVHVLIDACYAGVGRDGAELLVGKRFAVPAYAVREQSRVVEWSAAGPNQLSGPLPAARHGAFTYLAIGALRGWADGQVDGVSDGVVSAEEALLYVNASLRALEVNDQDSQLVASDPSSVVLGRSGGEHGPDLATVRGRSEPAAQVRVVGAGDVDYAALAREAEAARLEGEAAEKLAQELQAKVAAERRRRLREAADEVRAKASADYRAIESLVQRPTSEGVAVLERWLQAYGDARVELDGVEEPVLVPEVALVRAALPVASGRCDVDGARTEARAASSAGSGVLAQLVTNQLGYASRFQDASCRNAIAALGLDAVLGLFAQTVGVSGVRGTWRMEDLDAVWTMLGALRSTFSEDEWRRFTFPRLVRETWPTHGQLFTADEVLEAIAAAGPPPDMRAEGMKAWWARIPAGWPRVSVYSGL